MPIVGEKKYNKILWKWAERLVSREVRKSMEKLGADSYIAPRDYWNDIIAGAYRGLVRQLNEGLRLHGTSLSKVTISKRKKRGGGFTVVLKDKPRSH